MNNKLLKTFKAKSLRLNKLLNANNSHKSLDYIDSIMKVKDTTKSTYKSGNITNERSVYTSIVIKIDTLATDDHKDFTDQFSIEQEDATPEYQVDLLNQACNYFKEYIQTIDKFKAFSRKHPKIREIKKIITGLKSKKWENQTVKDIKFSLNNSFIEYVGNNFILRISAIGTPSIRWEYIVNVMHQDLLDYLNTLKGNISCQKK